MDNLQGEGARLFAQLKTAITQATQQTQREAEAITPKRSGRLAAGFAVVAGPGGVQLVNPVPYYPEVNQRHRLDERILAAHLKHVQGKLNDLS